MGRGWHGGAHAYAQMSGGSRGGISIDVTELAKKTKVLERHGEELEKARKAAEAASASKSSFLENASHEIRTPRTCCGGS
jgi:signal transduction histidine kinase